MCSPTREDVHVSVVAPAYNEAENLPGLVRETEAAVAPLGKPWEMVLVDDGSWDRSQDVLRGLAREVPPLRCIALRRQAGQTAALEAGLRAACGRFIATLDADGQNDPAEIPRLLAMVERGECDFANGWRTRRSDSWLRRLSTRIANGVRNALTHEDIHDSACGLKVFRRECIANVKLFDGLHRFLPTLVRLEGFRVVEVPVNHRPRTAGEAKYGVWNRVFRALRDCFAIRWMQRRMIRYRAVELEAEDVAGTGDET